MSGIRVGELRDYINNLDVSLKSILEVLNGLDRSAALGVTIPIKCSPFWDPPTLFQACVAPLETIDRGDITVEDCIEALAKIESWLRDMHEIVAAVDPDISLPPMPEEQP
jgi:hypothetical protein